MIMPLPKITNVTPVFIGRASIRLAFWVDRLGFVAENQVPGPDGKLIFASAKKDGIEVMYQTRASVLAERPDASAELAGNSTALFLQVDDLDAAERATKGAPVVKARHTTFYGSTEFYVREPGGTSWVLRNLNG